MEFYDEKIKALAIEIYELDAEVYKKLGSSLGRVFGGEKDICIRNIMEDLHSRQNSSRIRSELALISNMARTIPDHDTRHDIMVKYNNIVVNSGAPDRLCRRRYPRSKDSGFKYRKPEGSFQDGRSSDYLYRTFLRMWWK